jgi:putative endonuclease
MPALSQHFGTWAESRAAEFLQGLGHRLEVQNFNTPFGEVDIISWDGDTLVFTEVKAFEHIQPGTHPAENVHRGKQKKIIRAATYYLAGLRREPFCRFDVITVILNPLYQLEHYAGAFTA